MKSPVQVDSVDLCLRSKHLSYPCWRSVRGGLTFIWSLHLVFTATLVSGFLPDSTIAQEDETPLDVEWISYFGGVEDETPSGLASDGEGNIYVSGYSRGSTLPRATNAPHPDAKAFRAFAAKLDPSGKPVWSTFVTSEGENSDFHDVEVDRNGNVYALGDGGPGLPKSPPELEGNFVTKFGPNGEILWTRYLGDGAAGFGPRMGLAIDEAGNVLVANTSGDDDMVGAVNERAGYHDPFVAKISPSGNVEWLKFGGGPESSGINDLALDSRGNIYLIGTADFGSREDPGADYGLPNSLNRFLGGRKDGILQKYSSTGDVIWSLHIGGDDDEGCDTISVVGESIYVGGNTDSDTLNLPQTVNEDGALYFAEVNPNGGVVWTSRVGVSDLGMGEQSVVIGNALYTPSITRNGGVTKVSTENGELLWHVDSNDIVEVIHTDPLLMVPAPDGTVYIAGYTEQEDIADPSHPYGGKGDVFIARIRDVGDTAPDCPPPGGEWHNGHYYLAVTDEMTWNEARAHTETLSCEGYAAHLVTLETEAENTFVADLLHRTGLDGSSWIGCSDVEVEGEWRWVTGALVADGFVGWDTGEPNDSGGEDHGEFVSTPEGKWNDGGRTDYRQAFTVEFEPASPDSDGDGLTDEEEGTYSTDPDDPDSDNDGVSDGAEIEAGTDPKNPGDNPGCQPPGVEAEVIGQWDFKNGDLSATVGDTLEFRTEAARLTTMFLATDSQEVGHIGGRSAKVMKVPHFENREDGYWLPLPASLANGGGEYINQWTLTMDVYYPPASSGKFRSLIQINDLDGSGDGDLFINRDNGIGIMGNYFGVVEPGRWHRIGFVLDLVKAGDGLFLYVDGQAVGSRGAGGIDGRWALRAGEGAIFFSDDSGETEMGYVSSIQLRSGVLSADQMAALGGPSAAGVPRHVPSNDADCDGLTTEEEEIHGTNVNDADSDDDGASDGTEVAAGTDPSDPRSKPGTAAPDFAITTVRVAGNELEFAFPSRTGHFYRLQSSLDLRSWTNDVIEVAGTGETMTLSAEIAAALEERYYRLLERVE